MTEKRKKFFAAASVVIFVLLTLALAYFVGRPLVENISDPGRFRAWVDEKGVFGKAAFVGVVVLQVIVAIIPGEPFEIGAGYAFGTLEGTILCMLGIVLGSVIVFGFVRKFGMMAVEVFFSREKIESLRFLKDTKRLTTVAFIVFLIPGTPKDVLTYFVGLTPMKLSTWIVIATVARIPSIITSTITGNQLGEGNHINAIVVFVITAVISVLGLIAYNALCRRGEKDAAPDDPVAPKK